MSNLVSPIEKVYDYTMEKIVSKQWKAGMKIMSENQLAKELDVSRISVRQALEKLVAFGLLVKKQGSGTVVNEIDSSSLFKNLVPILALAENDIQAILQFRVYFEPANVIMFMQNYDDNILTRLKVCYENMVANYDDPEKYHLYDYEFHNLIAKGTKNPIVLGISEILHSILKYNLKQLYQDLGPERAKYYHQQIIYAIENKDGEMASLLMKRHIEEGLNNLSK